MCNKKKNLFITAHQNQTIKKSNLDIYIFSLLDNLNSNLNFDRHKKIMYDITQNELNLIYLYHETFSQFVSLNFFIYWRMIVMLNHEYKMDNLDGEIFGQKQYQQFMCKASNIIQTKYKSCAEQFGFICSCSNKMVQPVKDDIQDEDDIDSNLNIGAIIDDKEKKFAIKAMDYFEEHGDWNNIRPSLLNGKRCLESKVLHELNSYKNECKQIQQEVDNLSIDVFNGKIKKDSFCRTLKAFLEYEFDNNIIKSACLDLMCRDYYAFLQDKNLVMEDVHEIAKLIFDNKQNNFDDKVAILNYLSKKSELNSCLLREFAFLFLDNIGLISPVEQVIFFKRFRMDMLAAVKHRINKIKETALPNKRDVTENYNIFNALIEFLTRKLITPEQFMDCIKKFDGQEMFSEEQRDALLNKITSCDKSIISAYYYIKIINAIKPIDIFEYCSAHNYSKLIQLISNSANSHNLLEADTKLDKAIKSKYKSIYLSVGLLDVLTQWVKNLIKFILKGEDCACFNYKYLKIDAAADKLKSVFKESSCSSGKSYKKNNVSIPRMASGNIAHSKNPNRTRAV